MIEVCTGLKPRDVMELVLWKDIKIKDSTELKMIKVRVDRFCDRLIRTLDGLHESIAKEADHKCHMKVDRQAKTLLDMTLSCAVTYSPIHAQT